ncbi:Hypothetical predicted protein [Cloeon dipterum]|uniref:Uncharacterized protein n=1 Tax=Cloeon dipterum TaxID=197152 RepID=A0A8S1DU28_9INSE|nr:Hypothetical predicted protein [Cloeon dipterum]
MEPQEKWLLCEEGEKLPAQNPVICGFTKDGKQIFVARAQVEDNLLPGYAMKGIGYFTLDDKYIEMKSGYYVLFSDSINFCENNTVALNQLVQVGHIGEDPLYAGSCKVDEDMWVCGTLREGYLTYAYGGNVLYEFETKNILLLAAK